MSHARRCDNEILVENMEAMLYRRDRRAAELKAQEEAQELLRQARARETPQQRAQRECDERAATLKREAAQDEALRQKEELERIVRSRGPGSGGMANYRFY